VEAGSTHHCMSRCHVTVQAAEADVHEVPSLNREISSGNQEGIDSN
jgi:hypothetical protein